LAFWYLFYDLTACILKQNKLNLKFHQLYLWHTCSTSKHWSTAQILITQKETKQTTTTAAISNFISYRKALAKEKTLLRLLQYNQ